MSVTYTTVAIVKKRLESIVGSGLSDPDIEENINQAEGLIDAAMRESFLSTFDSSKHFMIRQCCTDLAAFFCLMYKPSAFANLSTYGASATLLWYSSDRSLIYLEDPRTIQYLKSL